MKRFKQSVGYARKGIAEVYARERNFRIHCLISGLVIVAGIVCEFGPLQWALISVAICMVLALEMINSAIEYSWDHLQPDHHPVVGVIKDVMAGAVLIASIFALIIGIIAFVFL